MRRGQGNARKIGSQDYCKLCGAKYTVEGGLQIYCAKCAEIINRERQRAAATARYHEKKDEINPKRNAKRRETPKERSLNTRIQSTEGPVAKNISRKKSGAFEVRCYRNNRSYYLGTYDTIDAATSARDRFLSSTDDADFVAVAAAIRAENSGRRKQSYLRLLHNNERRTKMNNVKIVNYDGTVLAEIATNHSMSIDEAISLAGEIHPEEPEENVEIGGTWYYYDDLELVFD